MSKSKRTLIVSLVSLLIIGGSILAYRLSVTGSRNAPLRVAVPPFVDTAFTAVGQEKGFFKQEHVEIRLVNTSWENQYDLLAGDGLDIAMSTLDEFVNKDRNLRLTGNRVSYFLPAWQFRGLAFYTTAGRAKPFSEFKDKAQYSTEQEAKNAFLAQFKGKKVVYPEGSVFEQAFRAFTEGTDYGVSSLSIVTAPLDAALNSLADDSVGIVAVGSQQRFEAERRGHFEAISPESLGLDILTGFIVRASTLESRRAEVLAFVRAWYRTAAYVMAEKAASYEITNSYLVSRGSNSLTFDEYQALRAYNVVPQKPIDAKALFFTPKAPAYWKTVWNRSLDAMRRSNRQNAAPPDEEGFVAPSINEMVTQGVASE